MTMTEDDAPTTITGETLPPAALLADCLAEMSECAQRMAELRAEAAGYQRQLGELGQRVQV